MARVRSKNSTPELAMRSAAHALGYSFRLHRKDLRGSPDMVFPRLCKIILVHGCFWHRRRGCIRTTAPRTRQEFWIEKLKTNIATDCRNLHDLKALGSDCRVIWECKAKDLRQLENSLRIFLESEPQKGSDFRPCGIGSHERPVCLSACATEVAARASDYAQVCIRAERLLSAKPKILHSE